MSHLLETQQLSFGYPDSSILSPGEIALKALDHVSLSVDPGRVLGIVGESGSGKSTLLRTIIGLIPNYRGTILFNGQAIDHKAGRARLQPFRTAVQMIFQDPGGSLNPFKTIGQTLSRALARQHGSIPSRQRIQELLARVGMDETSIDRRPSEFSGGQLQRLAIARALACNPALLLCDEPTSALDVSIQAQILDLFNSLKQQGCAFIFVTHNLGVLGHMADTIMVMRRGQVIETGPAKDVIAHPREDYTSALIAASPRLRNRGILLANARERLRDTPDRSGDGSAIRSVEASA